MRISTAELIYSLPPYMVELISSRILGRKTDAETLASTLDDIKMLGKVLDGLSAEDRALLEDLKDLGGYVSWPVVVGVYYNRLDEIKSRLERLGNLGLVFQCGLTGRDPLILLPSIEPILETYANKVLPHGLDWMEHKGLGISGHVLMINVIQSRRIRCRSGMEPFKKGWTVLEETLGSLMDVERVYKELVSLGCLEEKDGRVVVNSGRAMALAMDGDIHYRLWRFFESLKHVPGLDTRVYAIIKDGIIPSDKLKRVIFLNMKRFSPEMPDAEDAADKLVELWKGLGILQSDATGEWLRFSPDVYKTLSTGRVEVSLRYYSEDVIVQPNMEVLVPMEFDPLDHLNLGEVADLKKADVVNIYRITKASVLRSLMKGWIPEKIQQFLERISRHEVSDSVLQTIKGWAKSLKEAHVIKGTFLVFPGGKDNVPRGLEEVLPGIYRIPDKCESNVVSFLNKKGVMVNSPGARMDVDEHINWGRALPLKTDTDEDDKGLHLKGVYPYGMLIPLPYGSKRIDVFRDAIEEGRNLIIFYPKLGYGEIQMKRINPVYVYMRSGVPFLEAFCEDTGEGEVFDINKIRAIFKQG